MKDRSPEKIDERIDNFLLNKMSESERELFEIALLEHPSLLEKLKFRESFIVELGKLDSIESNASPNSSAKKSNSLKHDNLTFINWVQQPYSIATAASIVLIALFVEPSLVSFQEPAPSAINLRSIESSVVLESFRGIETRTEIRTEVPMIISIDIGPINTTSFQVSIVEDLNGSTVSELPNLQISNSGLLQMMLNTELQGEYTITVSKENGENIQSFPVLFF